MSMEAQEWMGSKRVLKALHCPYFHQLYADVVSTFIVNKRQDSNIRNCLCIAGIVVKTLRTLVI